MTTAAAIGDARAARAESSVAATPASPPRQTAEDAAQAPQRPAPKDPLRAGAALPPDTFAHVRRRMVLDCCKWDPQVGDVSTLAQFPLLISRRDWKTLAHLSEQLAAELAAAEAELLMRPDLHARLAVPRRVRHALRQIDALGPTPTALRTIRLDFHWTDDGWRISEANSDVPGGFSESSAFPAMMAEGLAGTATPAGDPATTWCDALAARVGGRGRVGLLSAPGFMEDQQVVAYMARRLSERGIEPHLADPARLCWVDRRAHVAAGDAAIPIDAVVRFYQAEWLARLPRRCDWRPLFAGGLTPVTNPGSAVLTESKRLPLVWDELRTPMPTWRRLLPETRDARDVPWRTDDGWLLKTAFCNTGDTVTTRDVTPPKDWRRTRLDVLLHPGHWLAQRRFRTLPVTTPIGEVYPCVGVYTIDGRAAGAYVRVAHRPVIDYRAIDVALLVEPDDERGTRS